MRPKPPTRKFTRALVAAAAAVAVSLTATACDAAPYAASTNSQVIKQIGLTSELKYWAGNQAYVSAFNSSNSSSNGGSGVTVVGDAPGTYNSTWVANILTGMIDALVVHQHLVATNNLPSQAVLNAAQSVNEISQIGWYTFPASFRQTLDQRLADRSMLGPPSVSQSTLQQAYTQYQDYFFSGVCAIEDSAPDAATATALSLSASLTGTPICYDQTQVEAYPQTYRNDLMQLKVGQLSQPIQTSTGYEVVEVTSRDAQGLSPAVEQVLATAVVAASNSSDPTYTNLVAAARVKINPAYGTWASSQVQPPQLTAG